MLASLPPKRAKPPLLQFQFSSERATLFVFHSYRVYIHKIFFLEQRGEDNERACPQKAIHSFSKIYEEKTGTCVSFFTLYLIHAY